MSNVNDPVYDDSVVDELFDGEPVAVHANTLVPGALDAPPVTNVKGFIPYRGSEQHGVRFAPESEGQTKINGYAAEQQAFERYVDPNVTARDIIPLQPIPVKIVDNIDLLYTRKARALTIGLDPTNTVSYVQVAQADSLRKRIIVAKRLTNGTFAVIRISPDQHPTDMTAFEVPSAGSAQFLDSEYTGPLFVRLVFTDSTQPINICVWTEYLEHNGEKLL